MADGNVKNITLEDDIKRQVRDNQIILDTLKKEDKHFTGYDKKTKEYDTRKMFDQILERNFEKWRNELAAIDDMEKQDEYYRTVIYPHIQYLEWRINDRHDEHGDGREYTKLTLYDESFDDMPDIVYRESADFLHELVTDPVLCRILRRLTPDQKEVIYNNAVLGNSVTDISVTKKTSERNIRKTKEKALRHIRGQYLPIVMFKYKIQTNEEYKWLYEQGVSTIFEERLFAATIGVDYIDYYGRITFDFVEITKDYRAQNQRETDRAAKWENEKLRRKELAEKKKLLKNQKEYGNIITEDNSYIKTKGTEIDYAQDI